MKQSPHPFTMPPQLRVHATAPVSSPTSLPSSGTPRLLPLSAPGKRGRRSQVRRNTSILALAATLLLLPTLLSSLARRRFRRLPGSGRASDVTFSAQMGNSSTVSLKAEQGPMQPLPQTLAHSLAQSPAQPPAQQSVQPSVRRPRTVVAVTSYGGIGNQIYFLLEALYLARMAKLDLVVPSVPERRFGKLAPSTPEISGAEVWNLPSLSRALSSGSRVLPGLPDVCEGRFDIVYVASRSKGPPGATAVVGSRARKAACFLLKGYDWGNEGPPASERECAERMFQGAPVERRALPLSWPPDRSFVEELMELRGMEVLPSGVDDMSKPACVLVDGHSFNIKGKKAHEYLHSFSRYLEPSHRVARVAATWDFGNLAVWHIRYDEKACVVRKGTEGKVCVRVTMDARRQDNVYWAPVDEVVGVVVRAVKAHKATIIYVSASPYMPEDTLSTLREKLSEEVEVAPNVDASLTQNDQNFVERELATHARCFIGDFASTWSGSVYYRRRTMGKATLWSNELLGKSRYMGYFDESEKIPEPEVFERTWLEIDKKR